jgi:CDP-2,3-bis-(O-geranylgeranyl)-sn-glycerol synthase
VVAGVAWASVLGALWLFLPAYVANMSPVFMAKLVPRWSAPIDGGRVAKDGQRVLGPGKTWRGLVGGALAGGLAALAVAAIAPHWDLVSKWDYGAHGYVPGSSPFGDGSLGAEPTCGTHLPDAPPPTGGTTVCDTVLHAAWWQVFLFGAALGFMALVGDAVKSYFKRRRKIARGGSWFPFDQLDFVAFGLLGAWLASPLLPDGWVLHAIFLDWVVLATLVVLTPALHLLVNRIGYWLGLKQVPW